MQGRSQKCISLIDVRGAIVVFRTTPKHKLGREGKIVVSGQISLNSVQKLQRRRQNISANQKPGRPSSFSDRSKNTKVGEDVELLLPVKFHQFCSGKKNNKYVCLLSHAEQKIMVGRSVGNHFFLILFLRTEFMLDDI